MAEYRRHEPEQTLLYRVVAAELEGLRESLSSANPHSSGLPKHVENELEAYLRCGILAHGFARVVCSRCRFEHLVAFSCKGRGICPSCTTRRMHDTAAHLVERVLPRTPMRQWVATFPRRVRWHLASDPKLASPALREVLREIFAFQRRRARKHGARPSRANSNGAITFVQRFNSALELSLHFHILIPDGVYLPNPWDPDARPPFLALDPPTNDEVASLLDRIINRVVALLERHGRFDGDDDDETPPPQMVLATQTAPGGTAFTEDPLPPRCARRDGFSLHAGAAADANDRRALERLCRYGLRPPLALCRLAEAPDGTIQYEMKRQFSDGRRVMRFTPREFVLRLCALVPPPGFHMVRYAGIFSAHARGRRALTGRGMHDTPPPQSKPDASPPSTPPLSPTPTREPRAADASPPTSSLEYAVAPLTPRTASTIILPDARDDGPDDAARGRRLTWSKLLKRVFGIDVL
ncbi:MAG: transposase, partial [Gemmatimonadales bacterium]